MTIFEALRRSQREVDELFGYVRNAIAAGQIDAARRLFHRVAVKLVAAMRAEHAVFYPRFTRDARLVDEIAHALREHDEIERVIDSLRIGGLPDPEWCEGIARLRVLVADHADSEECALFPLASLSLTADALCEIATEYDERMRAVAPIAGASITYDLPLADALDALVVRVHAA